MRVTVAHRTIPRFIRPSKKPVYSIPKRLFIRRNCQLTEATTAINIQLREYQRVGNQLTRRARRRQTFPPIAISLRLVNRQRIALRVTRVEVYFSTIIRFSKNLANPLKKLSIMLGRAPFGVATFRGSLRSVLRTPSGPTCGSRKPSRPEAKNHKKSPSLR